MKDETRQAAAAPRAARPVRIDPAGIEGPVDPPPAAVAANAAVAAATGKKRQTEKEPS